MIEHRTKDGIRKMHFSKIREFFEYWGYTIFRIRRTSNFPRLRFSGPEEKGLLFIFHFNDRKTNLACRKHFFKRIFGSTGIRTIFLIDSKTRTYGRSGRGDARRGGGAVRDAGRFVRRGDNGPFRRPGIRRQLSWTILQKHEQAKS